MLSDMMLRNMMLCDVMCRDGFGGKSEERAGVLTCQNVSKTLFQECNCLVV
jgi:hypothetical protein